MKKLKSFIIKNFYHILNPIRKSYWFIFRPKTKGVKCVVEFQGKILLARLSYAHKLWTFPGGGVNRNESFCNAAIREVKEETGIDVMDVKEIGEYMNYKEYKIDTVKCFGAKATNSIIEIDESEIIEAEWFEPEDLPDDRVRQVNNILKMYNKNNV